MIELLERINEIYHDFERGRAIPSDSKMEEYFQELDAHIEKCQSINRKARKIKNHINDNKVFTCSKCGYSVKHKHLRCTGARERYPKSIENQQPTYKMYDYYNAYPLYWFECLRCAHRNPFPLDMQSSHALEKEPYREHIKKVIQQSTCEK